MSKPVEGRGAPWACGLLQGTWTEAGSSRCGGDVEADLVGRRDFPGSQPTSGEWSWQGRPGREAGPRGAGGPGGQVDREGQATEVLTVRVTSVMLPRTQEATSHGWGSRPGTCSTWPEGQQQHKDGADRAGAEDKISKGEIGTGLTGGLT